MPAATQPLLETHDLSVGYPGRPVLEHLNLRLTAGCLTGLLGPNGAGKTTLLKTLAGILPPLAGRLTFHPPAGPQVRIGYVPQRESLAPQFLFNSLDVALMGTCGRIPPGRFYPAAEKAFAAQCLADAGAADLTRRRFSELSGGQKQRVLIARALATRPELLLLDEPTSGLDVTATDAILDLLQRLQSEHRLTILMVNHDVRAVRRCAAEVVWLHDGRAEQGPTDRWLTRAHLDEILKLELD